MDVVVPESKLSEVIDFAKGKMDKGRLRVKRKALQEVLEQCQRALELLSNDGVDDDADGCDFRSRKVEEDEEGGDEPSTLCSDESSTLCGDGETDELSDLLKSRFECPDFLEKLQSAQMSITEECSSWDMVSEHDLWEGGNSNLDQEDYVLVRQEDIVDGVACFMAAYLSSLKQTKDVTPNQLQEALSKTFSVKKKKGKLRKAWEGSKVIYNVASWGATAIGIYQNPALLRAATAAFWTSCGIISKLF